MSDIDPSLKAYAECVGRNIAIELIKKLRHGALPIAPEYLTALQVSELTGFSEKGLENMRARGDGPRFLKVGTSVRYRIEDVRTWVENGGQR
jgi:predicted DNA-binding transcriptional regulator AlpA